MFIENYEKKIIDQDTHGEVRCLPVSDIFPIISTKFKYLRYIEASHLIKGIFFYLLSSNKIKIKY